MKAIDLFCGAGGFSAGLSKAGFEIVFGTDDWNDAIKTFSHNFPNAKVITGDIRTIKGSQIKETVGCDIDVIVGGPPCQGFSTVSTRKHGKRNPEDERNFLYLEFLRIVKEIKPKAFIIENVVGLSTIKKGEIKEKIFSDFKNLGYTVKIKTLNAADYGIPQRRLRLFFVGYKKKGDFCFPEPKSKKVTVYDAISDLPSLDVYKNGMAPSEFCYDSKGLISTYQKKLRINSSIIRNHELTNHTDKTIDVISKIKEGGRIKDLPQKYWNIRKYNKSFERMNRNKISNTIDTGHRNYFHFKENRVPSVRECARIQSFNDNFVFLGSKTSQYKQVGNAVPPLLAEEVGKALINFLKK